MATLVGLGQSCHKSRIGMLAKIFIFNVLNHLYIMQWSYILLLGAEGPQKWVLEFKYPVRDIDVLLGAEGPQKFAQ